MLILPCGAVCNSETHFCLNPLLMKRQLLNTSFYTCLATCKILSGNRYLYSYFHINFNRPFFPIIFNRVWTEKERGQQLFLIMNGKPLGERILPIKMVSLEFILLLVVAVHCKGMSVWPTGFSAGCVLLRCVVPTAHKYALFSLFIINTNLLPFTSLDFCVTHTYAVSKYQVDRHWKYKSV